VGGLNRRAPPRCSPTPLQDVQAPADGARRCEEGLKPGGVNLGGNGMRQQRREIRPLRIKEHAAGSRLDVGLFWQEEPPVSHWAVLCGRLLRHGGQQRPDGVVVAGAGTQRAYFEPTGDGMSQKCTIT
jgi:hypothetical protein